MIISLIVAMDENGGIGSQNRLPWHLSSDLKRFKALTMGHHLIMGRKTYDSIGRSLPGRSTIVVTRSLEFKALDCSIVHSLYEGIDLARKRGETEVFIIGGGEIFSQALPIADRIYLTRVHTSGVADTYFPEFNPQEWLIVDSERHEADLKNEYAYTFSTLHRKPLPSHDLR